MTRTHLIAALLIAGTFSAGLASAQPASGPPAARPDRGVANAAALSVSDIENISLTNGNLNLSLPLASLPPIAGGKLSLTLKATYNSKLWNVTRQEVRAPGLSYNTYLVDSPQLDARGGWAVGGSYSIAVREAVEDVNYYRPQQSEDPHEWSRLQRRLYKVVLITPDGAERELRPTDHTNTYNGTRDFLRGYSYDTPDTVGAALRYYSYDGSHLFAVIEPSGSAAEALWTVFTPDGGKVVQYKNGVQRIKDANGNSIKIWSTLDGVTHYQDEQSGREIKITDNGNDLTQVWRQTVGGGWVSVDIRWGWTQVRGKVYDVEDWWAGGGETGEGAPCRRQAVLANTDLRVIREIVFPPTEPGAEGRRYTFSYDSDQTEPASTEVRWACGQLPETYSRTASLGTGALSRMVAPTGAVVNYRYEYLSPLVSPHYYFEANEIAREVITEKRVTHDGTTDTWDYQIGTNASTVTSPDGTSSSDIFYPHDPTWGLYFAQTAEKSGLVYRSRVGNTIVERHWKLMPFSGANTAPLGVSGSTSVNFNPVVDAEYLTLTEGGQAVKMSARTYRHDYNGNLLETKEYDWFDPSLVSRDNLGIPTAVPDHPTVRLLRTTTNSYHNGAPTADSPNVYAKRAWGSFAPLILAATQETAVGPGRTRYSYDNLPFGAAPTAGNLTRVSSFDDRGTPDAADDGWVENSFTYDGYGNTKTAVDRNGNVTESFYEDATHALPTKMVVDPLNGTGQQTTHTSFDFFTGLVTSQTDVNGNTSTIDYTNQLTGAVDPFGRPGVVSGPPVEVGGVSQRRRVFTFYEDGARRVRVEADLRAEGDRLLKSRETRDQLGRPSLSERNEDGSANYTISSRTIYEEAGRVTLTSNPSRNDGAPTDGWTRTTKDQSGRTVEVASFAGASRPHATDEAATIAGWTGSVRITHFANETTVADQENKSRKSVSDGLGRLTQVVEAPGSLNYQTTYSYDTLGNLLSVAQAGQTRTFTYSTLSRLASAVNPESGTVTYTYDANGNLLTKSDARGVTTTYVYDGLNRVVSRSYAAPPGVPVTPSVTYTYDTVPNRKGLLASISNGVSAYHYTGYDSMGRVTGSAQVTGGQTYTMSYGYDLAGNLTTEVYPSGRVVTTTLDDAGRLNALGGQKPGEAAKVYASQFAYAAHGAASRLKLGNSQPGNEKWEHTIFNSRFQPVEIGLGTSAADASILKLSYGFGTTDNSGNVRSQRITIAGSLDLTQTYGYDDVSRLKLAREVNNATPCRTQSGAVTDCWKQGYTYLDSNNQNGQHGNRRIDAADTTSNVMPPSNPTVNPSNNRFNDGQGYAYDSVGNMTAAPGFSYTYDAENKQVSADDGQQYGLSTYAYDGEGRRVKTVTGSGNTTTIFVYNATGQLVAEYSNQTGNGGTSYLTQDQLGSTRVVTDGTGAVKSRHDYLPFGENLPDGISGRMAQQRYSQSGGLRQGFTGYEKDGETGLNFAQARYYAPHAGRFTSPDDFLNDSQPSDPASWNLYAYTRNNPLKYVDPTGEVVDGSNLSPEERRRVIRELAALTGYSEQDISFDPQTNLLTINPNATPIGGSATARRLLNDAINSNWVFRLDGVSSHDVAFAQHVPTRGAPIIRPNGTRVSNMFGLVNIDFGDFDQIIADTEVQRSAFSLGLNLLHEFVHGLEQNLQDGSSPTDPGQIEEKWINPIRRELGLPTRDGYAATPMSEQQLRAHSMTEGVQLPFRSEVVLRSGNTTFRNPPPEKRVPIVSHIYWRFNTVGGRRAN